MIFSDQRKHLTLTTEGRRFPSISNDISLDISNRLSFMRVWHTTQWYRSLLGEDEMNTNSWTSGKEIQVYISDAETKDQYRQTVEG
jgi:hypothetical protein